ncbi:regulatory protein RecX [Paenibacillus gansuensis]|uniref:Regulatory protein RecX n=1 Tax=Paenibacillus gansuensis TaxID=306542 RepID=A0ABW5PEV0_9BACL
MMKPRGKSVNKKKTIEAWLEKQETMHMDGSSILQTGEQEEEQAAMITSVERQKRSKHRYNIHVGGTYAFSVHEDIMIKHRLLKGEMIPSENFEQILQDEERHSAYFQAVRFISHRPRTVKELRLKLKEKGYEPELIDYAVERLKEQKFVDDKLFAQQLAESRIYSQKKGRNLVQQELAQKGVPKEHIQSALERVDPERELASAMELGLKRWKLLSGSGTDKSRKLYGFLLRRGYSSSQVQKVLRACIDGEAEMEADEMFLD